MGFYLRKSIRVGPVRFNLSKSGVGVSAGVRGFRLGAGPRGNYVHMGAHGLYYRAALPATSAPSSSAPKLNLAPVPDQLTEIESAAVSAMQDSSSASLLAELDQKRKTFRWFPLTAVAGAALSLSVLGNVGNPAVSGITVLAAIAASWAARSRDVLAKTTVLLYELEPDAEAAYQRLHDAIDELAACGCQWHVEAEGSISDHKRHAGASSVVRRKPTKPAKGEPPFVKTNLSLPYIPVGRQTLWFFPDRLLVFEPAGVGAVPYEQVRIARQQTRFIEDGTVPKDAQVVGHTWKYVNKRGGPDKRFKGNRELPIALYEDIHFTSLTGLNELVQISKTGAGAAIEAAVQGLAQLGAGEGQASAVQPRAGANSASLAL
ncbi:MAG: DUF4236 domain-containing protein [Vicinamibacterales bacterium]